MMPIAGVAGARRDRRGAEHERQDADPGGLLSRRSALRMDVAGDDVAELVRDDALDLVHIVGELDQARLEIDGLALATKALISGSLRSTTLTLFGSSPAASISGRDMSLEQQLGLGVAQDLRAASSSCCACAGCQPATASSSASISRRTKRETGDFIGRRLPLPAPERGMKTAARADAQRLAEGPLPPAAARLALESRPPCRCSRRARRRRLLGRGFGLRSGLAAALARRLGRRRGLVGGLRPAAPRRARAPRPRPRPRHRPSCERRRFGFGSSAGWVSAIAGSSSIGRSTIGELSGSTAGSLGASIAASRPCRRGAGDGAFRACGLFRRRLRAVPAAVFGLGGGLLLGFGGGFAFAAFAAAASAAAAAAAAAATPLARRLRRSPSRVFASAGFVFLFVLVVFVAISSSSSGSSSTGARFDARRGDRPGAGAVDAHPRAFEALVDQRSRSTTP